MNTVIQTHGSKEFLGLVNPVQININGKYYNVEQHIKHNGRGHIKPHVHGKGLDAYYVGYEVNNPHARIQQIYFNQRVLSPSSPLSFPLMFPTVPASLPPVATVHVTHTTPAAPTVSASTPFASMFPAVPTGLPTATVPVTHALPAAPTVSASTPLPLMATVNVIPAKPTAPRQRFQCSGDSLVWHKGRQFVVYEHVNRRGNARHYHILPTHNSYVGYELNDPAEQKYALPKNEIHNQSRTCRTALFTTFLGVAILLTAAAVVTVGIMTVNPALVLAGVAIGVASVAGMIILPWRVSHNESKLAKLPINLIPVDQVD